MISTLAVCRVMVRFYRQVSDTCHFIEVCSRCYDSCDDIPEDVVVDDDDFVPYCASVPTGVNGSHQGATLETLELEPGYYRVSNESHDVRECYYSNACQGGADASNYCQSGYTGICKSPFPQESYVVVSTRSTRSMI